MIDKRQAILNATGKLLAKHGFHGFSMKQLASSAGVAAGTIYLYFKDRDDLIEQLHEQILLQVAEFVFAGHDESEPLFQQYRYIWLRLWAFCLRYPDLVMCKTQFDHLPPEVLQQRHSEAKLKFYPLIDIFTIGREQGLIKPLSDEALGCLSIETCAELARKQLHGLLTLDDDSLEAVVVASWDAISLKQFKTQG